MAKTHTPPSHTAQSLLKAAQNVAFGDLPPPASYPLSPEAMEFWPAIMRMRARDQWREGDLVFAAQLCECQYEIKHNMQYIRAEGDVVWVERKGGPSPVPNPRIAMVAQYRSGQLALVRTLLLGGTTGGADKRNGAGAVRNETAARAAAAQVEAEEDLLA